MTNNWEYGGTCPNGHAQHMPDVEPFAPYIMPHKCTVCKAKMTVERLLPGGISPTDGKVYR